MSSSAGNLLDQQYDVIYGRMPEKYNEVVLIVSGNNEVTDYTLYSIGVLDSEQLGETLGKMIRGEEAEWPEPKSYSYEELCGLKFKLLLNSDYFAKENGVWVDKSKDDIYMMNALEKAETISIVGILKSESEAAQNGLAGTIRRIASQDQI